MTLPGPNVYVGELGMPLYWGDETGDLKAAVLVFLNICTGGRQPTSEEMRHVCAYCEYFINAPCWLEKHLVPDYIEQHGDEIRQLRLRAKTLASVESVRRWVGECMDIALDPF